MKLFEVLLRELDKVETSEIRGHKKYYVVAEDQEKVCKIVDDYLEKEGIRNNENKEIEYMELVAREGKCQDFYATLLIQDANRN